MWAASPLPAINENKYLNKFKGWLWDPKGFPDFKNEYEVASKLIRYSEPNKQKKNHLHLARGSIFK